MLLLIQKVVKTDKDQYPTVKLNPRKRKQKIEMNLGNRNPRFYRIIGT
ncbi:hypothetical protein MNV_1340003 [Candidatus Methanoperedens nitroreducens]|uniref:Uncharacterized protein n=1 Tax=Candidatus Methanoperedens nitratireducens TaxID=1392998 RepID=A0A284VKM7_9EURY|nr:hypothetical protein MNV_1340003 [Candidatus Methanoperedens nitroreducens]